MSRSIKLHRPPQFTVDIVEDARESILAIMDDLARLMAEHPDDIAVWGSAVTTAGWEVTRLGQWLGLEGEATLLLGGASYPEIAEHQGTTQSNVYNRIGRSLTLAPYAKASGSVTRVSAEGLEAARRDYAADEPTSGGAPGAEEGDDGESLAGRIPGILRSGPQKTIDVVAALPDYRRSSVLSTLSVLTRRGVIARVGHGVYALPQDAGPGARQDAGQEAAPEAGPDAALPRG